MKGVDGTGRHAGHDWEVEIGHLLGDGSEHANLIGRPRAPTGQHEGEIQTVRRLLRQNQPPIKYTRKVPKSQSPCQVLLPEKIQLGIFPNS